MILSTSMSDPPRLLSALPATIGDVSMARNPLEEAEQMCSSFMGEYEVPTSPCDFDLIQEFKIECPEKELWKLLPTPPRSPDRSDYASLVNGSADATSTGTIPCAYPSGGSISQAWAGCGMDEWGYFDETGAAPPADDEEALSAIMFEHDDLIEQLLRDDAVFNSVLDGAAAEPGGFDELPVEDWSSSTAPTQPAVKSELLHDCMWSGQCTDDCKQKAAREKREALAATPTSSLDAVAPASAMSSADDDAVVPLLRRTAAVSGVIDDESVAQCVDPSSVLGYTPLSDHSYHQAQSSAPPTPPDSPRVPAAQQQSSSASGQSSSTSGGTSGSTSSQPILLVRSRNGVWKREVVVSDTPSESDDDDDDDDDDEEEEEREKQNDGDDDDSDDDDDDDDEEDEEIDVVTVVGERHHAGRQGMPAVVALPTHSAVGTMRASHVSGVRSRNVGSAPASPVVVSSRMTSSGRVVTPSQKLLSTGPTSRRRRGPHSANAAHHSTVNGGKRRRSRHSGHHMSTPQAKRSRRDDDDDDDSCSSTTPSTNGRRGHHHHSLSQLPPSAKRNEHNTMERKRRDDLRVAFQQLRVQVPSLAENKKAAKVTILSEAATFVTKLANDSTHLQKTLWRETQRRELLKQQLAELQGPTSCIRPYPRYRR